MRNEFTACLINLLTTNRLVACAFHVLSYSAAKLFLSLIPDKDKTLLC